MFARASEGYKTSRDAVAYPHDVPEPAADSARPPRGPGPPAPPDTGEPSRGPDPADPGPPIAVRLDELLLGDLGHACVDARLLRAIIARDGRVSTWLRTSGIDADAVEKAFPDSGWEPAPQHG
jgi:hypothetical protein